MLCLLCSAEQSELGRVEVEYLAMPGWKTSIAHSKSISDLPPNAKAYVEKIWELTGIPGELYVPL
jgi:adenylosuccinate synthase